MRERIWYELTQARHDHYCCTLLLSYNRKVISWFNITTLAFSGVGVMGWKIWEYMPIVACAIISIVQLIKLLQPHILPSEKNIIKLEDIIDFYFDRCNDVEQLWYNYQSKKLTEEEAVSEFYRLRAKEKVVAKNINEVVKQINNSIKKKADKETRHYLKIHFNTQV